MFRMPLDEELAISGVGQVGVFQIGHTGNLALLCFPETDFLVQQLIHFINRFLPGRVFAPIGQQRRDEIKSIFQRSIRQLTELW